MAAGTPVTRATPQGGARIAEHVTGEVHSTRHRRPLRLIDYEACRSEADAKRRERYLKTGKGKNNTSGNGWPPG